MVCRVDPHAAQQLVDARFQGVSTRENMVGIGQLRTSRTQPEHAATTCVAAFKLSRPQESQAVFNWVNRSSAAAPVAVMALPTASMFAPASPLPRFPTAVCSWWRASCRSVTCAL